ncbi:hypothetical protein MsAg5_10310 [Methanosarcinaceae archaeon Ag5]|uniref:Uncharacterized protein n=1 Tax=Methanolapillus africanus TaxID=3028297 RepID=A0AAE4MJV2_9EURY|nr:hypothetical protein [Methanosarcinaceae archaeon Ag5]
MPRMGDGTKVRMTKTDPQGEANIVVKEYNISVDFPEIAETTPTERQFMELEALNGVLEESDRFRIEIYNPGTAIVNLDPVTSKISIPYRLLNNKLKTTSNRVMTLNDLDISKAAILAGTKVPLYPRQWTNIGEYTVYPKTTFKLGHTTAGGLDKNNDRLLIVPYV